MGVSWEVKGDGVALPEWLTRSLETEVVNDATNARRTLNANQLQHLDGAAMSVEERLERIEQMLATLVQQQTCSVEILARGSEEHEVVG
jgi:hypothetical protein